MQATELEFLRLYYKQSVSHFKEDGTDEDYWFKEELVESAGKELPDGYEF